MRLYRTRAEKKDKITKKSLQDFRVVLSSSCRTEKTKKLNEKTMNNQQKQLFERIIKRENPICLHALGQPLVNELCEIIRAMNERNREAIATLSFSCKNKINLG